MFAAQLWLGEIVRKVGFVGINEHFENKFNGIRVSMLVIQRFLYNITAS